MNDAVAAYREALEVAGATLWARAIRKDDYERERVFARSLSAQTVYQRFFSPLPDLPDALARAFTDVDYQATLALIAEDLSTSPSAIAGVARFVALDSAEVEFALVVADAWQGRGLGRLLLIRLIGWAQRLGYSTMVGSILAENRAMRHLAESLGFVPAAPGPDPVVVQVRRSLAADPTVLFGPSPS